MIVIQKRVGDDGEWIDWDNAESLAQAIGRVKQYCLGDQAAFRVVECLFGGVTVEFEWGPFGPVLAHE